MTFAKLQLDMGSATLYDRKHALQKKGESWNALVLWALKNWCFWTVELGKTLESLLDFKEIKPVNPKGNQLWIFIGRTDAEAEAPILWPPIAKSQVIEKDSDAGEHWRQEEKGVTEDEMVAWHHRLNGCEFEQTLGDSEGQRNLVGFSPWGWKESDMTEQQNSSNWYYNFIHTCYLETHDQMVTSMYS